jgi:RecA-family ATPase
VTLGVAEIFAALPPITWRIEGLKLAPGATAVFAGYGYVAKSMALQSIGVSCAAGRPVFGVYRVDPCRVLHLDYEQGRRLTFERYQRLARAMAVDPRELEDRLRVAIHPALYLDSAGAEDALTRAFEGVGIVIVDSLRAAAPSADENSSEIRRHIDVMSRAAEKTGALPLLVHHARKPSEMTKGGAKMTIRGSSAIFDACASVFVLDAEKGEPTRVHHEKDRITGTTVADFGLSVEDVAIDGDPRGGLRIVHLEAEQLAPVRDDAGASRFCKAIETARKCIAENPGIAGAEAVREHVGARAGIVRAAVKQLLADGDVVARKGNRNGLRLYLASAAPTEAV